MIDDSDIDNPDIEEAISKAALWLRPEPIKGIAVLYSSLALEHLSGTGRFPAQPYLTRVLESTQLIHVISSRQMATNIARFLSNATAVEDLCPISFGLLEYTSADPDVLSEIRAPDLRHLSRETAAFMSVNCEALSSQETGLLYAYNRQKASSQKVRLATEILGLEPAELEQKIGKRVERNISILSVPSAYCGGLDALSVWRTAATAAELRWAIQCQAERLAHENARTSLKDFRIGTEFLTLLRQNQCLGEGRFCSVVLSKCSQLVAGLENLDVDDFRESEAPDSPPRKRIADGAIAKRVHITDRHEALRLMFWLRAGDIIEFASVRGKFDLMIDDGDPEQAV
jgi:hypothetical protein